MDLITTAEVPTLVGMQAAATPAESKPRRKTYTQPGSAPDTGDIEVQDNGALVRAKAEEWFASGEAIAALAEDLGLPYTTVAS